MTTRLEELAAAVTASARAYQDAIDSVQRLVEQVDRSRKAQDDLGDAFHRAQDRLIDFLTADAAPK